ncbi:MAG: carboxypeptidase-like regulatory domain-containing protein, partial [Flavisolibacter sp.]
MRGFLLTFFLVFAVVVSQAQSFRLSGKVTNTTGEPLAFVTIQLKEQGIGTTSKEDGSYAMNLEVGQYNLVVSMIDYKTQIINIVLNRDYPLDIVLEE